MVCRSTPWYVGVMNTINQSIKLIAVATSSSDMLPKSRQLLAEVIYTFLQSATGPLKAVELVHNIQPKSPPVSNETPKY